MVLASSKSTSRVTKGREILGGTEENSVFFLQGVIDLPVGHIYFFTSMVLLCLITCAMKLA